MDAALDLGIDSRRIYATGLSNGGWMAARLAMERSDMIAAIATVACAPEVPDPLPARLVPWLHFHGDADEHVPLGGGVGKRSQTGAYYAPAEPLLSRWAAAAGCGGPATQRLEPANPEDPTRVEVIRWRGEREYEIEFIKIHGHGHTWPGVDNPWEGMHGDYGALGPATHQLHASDWAWGFFQRHILPE
jgi:polyhydroxybutyrate depolymerase